MATEPALWGDRRIFFQRLALGGAGIVAATGLSAHGATSKSASAAMDVTIMDGALAIEHEGIAAYRVAAKSGLLKPGTLKLANLFRGHHEQHRDALAGLITKAGGKPVQPKPDSEYAKELNLGALKSEGDVVVFATKLELSAANAYAGQVAALRDRQLVHLFTQLSSDEAVHWATLNNASGKPIPAKAFIFG